MTRPLDGHPGPEDHPLLSVVVPSVNGLPAVAECLACLMAQEGGIAAEVVVVDRCGEAVRGAIRDRFPSVQIVPVEASSSIPAMRGLGIARARGRVVAIIEDHCMAAPGWSRAIARSIEAGHEAVGGPVENGCTERTVDWAVFFCEYARFMGPAPRGVVDEIAGNNGAYSRRVLDRLGPELGAEVWESFLHARMRELGVAFHSEPEMLVSHKKSFGFGYFLSQRYHYSRSFAGMRLRGAPWWKRLGYAGAATLLPGLLLGRIAAVVLRKGRHLGPFLRGLPSLGVFLVGWAVGEGVGALLGPGRSLQRVE